MIFYLLMNSIWERMGRYLNKYPILTECQCGGKPRIAFEHNINCPIRLSFFGADSKWGIGIEGEIRVDDNFIFYIFSNTWVPIDKSSKEVKQKLRKEKLNIIQKIKQ